MNQVNLVLVASVAMGFVFGLIFGIMDIEVRHCKSSAPTQTEGISTSRTLIHPPHCPSPSFTLAIVTALLQDKVGLALRNSLLHEENYCIPIGSVIGGMAG